MLLFSTRTSIMVSLFEMITWVFVMMETDLVLHFTLVFGCGFFCSIFSHSLFPISHCKFIDLYSVNSIHLCFSLFATDKTVDDTVCMCMCVCLGKRGGSHVPTINNKMLLNYVISIGNGQRATKTQSFESIILFSYN